MSALQRTRLVLLAAAGGCLLVGLTVMPLARLVSPRVAVAELAENPIALENRAPARGSPARLRAVDPWGHCLLYNYSDRGVVIYSAGPNGVDDDRQGDDLVVDDSDRSRLDLLGRTQALIPLAGLLAWLGVGPYSGRRRSPSAGLELRRAAVVAVGFVVLVFPLLVLAAGSYHGLTGILSQRPLPVFGHPAFAMCGTYLVACYMAAVTWRLSRQPEYPVEG